MCFITGYMCVVSLIKVTRLLVAYELYSLTIQDWDFYLCNHLVNGSKAHTWSMKKNSWVWVQITPKVNWYVPFTGLFLPKFMLEFIDGFSANREQKKYSSKYNSTEDVFGAYKCWQILNWKTFVYHRIVIVCKFFVLIDSINVFWSCRRS